jgi:hypothetical protein
MKWAKTVNEVKQSFLIKLPATVPKTHGSSIVFPGGTIRGCTEAITLPEVLLLELA